MPVLISNRSELTTALEAALRNNTSYWDTGIEFQNGPHYEVTIKGVDFNGEIPVRIMPAFLQLQRTINHTYARCKYGDHNRRLTDADRELTKLSISTSPSSTKFISDLLSILNSMVRNMTGRQKVAVILGLATLITSGIGLKMYLDHRYAVNAYNQEISLRIKLSEQETRTLELFKELAERNQDVSDTRRDYESTLTRLMLNLEDDDVIVIDRKGGIRGYDAKRIAREPNTPHLSYHVRAEFLIHEVESGQVQQGFRARVQNLETNEIHNVEISENILSEASINTIKASEWRKTPISLLLEIERGRNKIVRANVLEVGHRSF